MNTTILVSITEETTLTPQLFPPTGGDRTWPFASLKISHPRHPGYLSLHFREVEDVERIVAVLQQIGNDLAAAQDRPGPSFFHQTRDGEVRFDDAADALHRAHVAGTCADDCDYCARAADETPSATIAPGPDDVPAPPPTACALCGSAAAPGDRHCSACLANIPF